MPLNNWDAVKSARMKGSVGLGFSAFYTDLCVIIFVQAAVNSFLCIEKRYIANFFYM